MAYDEEMAMGEEGSGDKMQEIEQLKAQVQEIMAKLEQMSGGSEGEEMEEEMNPRAQKLMQMKRMQQMSGR